MQKPSKLAVAVGSVLGAGHVPVPKFKVGDAVIIEYEIPASLVRMLERQGTSEQEFSDGYEAAASLRKYRGKKIDEWHPR